MVNYMATLVSTKDHNGILSQNSEQNVTDTTVRAVDNPTAKSDGRKGSVSIEMTAKDEFEEFARPRSFSDISLSSGKYALPKRVRRSDGEGQKTSMKVLVARKSEVIRGLNLEKQRQSADGQAVLGLGRTLLDQQIKYEGEEHEDQDAPPKPKLPTNYVPKYFSQELQKQRSSDEIGRGRLGKDSSTEAYYGITDSRDRAARSSKSFDEPTKRASTLPGGAGLNTHSGNTMKETHSKLRPQRSSAPNLKSTKSFSVVYRHHDAKMQSELLKKELDLLSKKEHVRRNSASMEQRLSSGERDQTGRNKGKAPDSHRRSFEGSSVGKDDFSSNRYSEKSRPVLVRQSKSYDQSSYRSEVKLGTVITDSLRNKIASENVREEKPTDYHNVAPGSNSSARESRAFVTDKQRTQARSKSASNLSRNLERNNLTNTLGSNPKNAQMSRSASNLRRKQDTIRKFNSSAAEQKRSVVRRKYQDHGGLQDDDDDDDNGDEPYQPARAASSDNRKVAQNTSHRLLDVKHEKPVGDNRSDEEKYADLSRNKILHNKSSSFDNQEKKETRSRNIPNHLSLDKMKALKVERTGARGVHGRRREASDLRGGASGGRGLKPDDEVSVSDSECVINRGGRQQQQQQPRLSEQKSLDSLDGSGSGAGTKVVLRQCRVGSGMAFGLVGVKETKEQVKEKVSRGIKGKTC